MKKINYNKRFTRTPSLVSGFTFVELLVVLAIFGILASVVYASLKSIRSGGSDATIKADLDSVRKLAIQEFINLQGKYSTTGAAITGADCATLTTANTIFANPRIQAALLDVKRQNGNIALSCEINASGSAYAIAVSLKTAGKYWCIDSTNVAKGTYGTGTTGYIGQYNSAVNYAIWPGTYVCN